MNGQPLTYYDEIRWMQARNVGAGTIPSFGLCQIVTTDADGTLQVQLPTADNLDTMVNGMMQMLAGAGGIVTRNDPILIQYNPSDGTPAPGQFWGSGTGSGLLRSNNKQVGWLIDGTPYNGLVMAQRWLPNPGDVNYWRQAGTSPLTLNYTGGSITGLSGFTAQGVANYMQGLAFVNPRMLSLDALKVWLEQNGPGGSKARLAIYQATSASNLWPKTLLVDSGDLTTSSGAPGYLSATINVILQAGTLYWLFFNCSSGDPPSGPLNLQGVPITGGTLTNATTYNYQVTAVTAGGETLPDSLIGVLTATPLLSALLTWDAFPGATGYKVYQNGLLLTTLGAVTIFTDNGSLSPGAGTPPTAATNVPFFGATTDEFLYNLLGADNTTWTQYYGILAPQAYGAFPNPFPAASNTYLTNGTFILPLVHLNTEV